MRHSHVAFHLQRREPMPSPLEYIINQLPKFSKRDSSESPPNICTKNDKSVQCAKPADSNNITLPVVLGIVYVSPHDCMDEGRLIMSLAFHWLVQSSSSSSSIVGM